MGKKCGQYRPARALAHVLHLYDPDFILLVDDDTFVSQRVLFSSQFHTFVNEYLIKQNQIFGDIEISNHDITRNGFPWGGAGYLFGRVVIQKLISNTLPGPTQISYEWSGINMTRELNILSQAYDWSERKCQGCVNLQHSNKKAHDLNQIGILSTRFIDLCANMFSHDDSCYSSDHALALCFAHGIYARFRTAPFTLKNHYGPMNFPLAMSYDYFICKSYHFLTCHRFKPVNSKVSHAISIYSAKDYPADNSGHE